MKEARNQWSDEKGWGGGEPLCTLERPDNIDVRGQPVLDTQPACLRPKAHTVLPYVFQPK